MKQPELLLVKPLLTEKALHAQEKRHEYFFKVQRDANKIEIRNAVEQKFNVNVEKVRTVVIKGKSKRMNTRRGMTFGKRATWKKAIVTLREGQSIDFFAEIGK